MSYCRWSSDNFQSDVYCYEGEDGFVTHVAGNRIVSDLPMLPEIPIGGSAEEWGVWFDVYTEQSEAVKTATRQPIGLPYDGQDFLDDSLEELEARLLHLREVGYRVPESALEMIREEVE